MIQHPLQPDRLYQQNHCGIYRLDRPARRWTRIGDDMPKRIGDIGFPIVLAPARSGYRVGAAHGRTDVWPRTSIDGKPAAYVRRNGGKSGSAWIAACRAPGLVHGAAPGDVHRSMRRGSVCISVRRSGEVWASIDEGAVVALHRAAPAGDLLRRRTPPDE